MRNITAKTGGMLSYFTRHGTAANLLLMIMLVAGAAAIPIMRAQFFPDVVEFCEAQVCPGMLIFHSVSHGSSAYSACIK